MKKGFLKKFHVHVYRVVGLQEIDIYATEVEDAESQALAIAKCKHENEQLTPWHEPDCKMLAIAPKGDLPK